MNVHKRCQKNVANNCGINTKQMAEILNQIGISPDKHTPRRSKYSNQSCSGSSGDGLSVMGGSDTTGSTGGSTVGGSSVSGDNGDESAEDNGK